MEDRKPLLRVRGLRREYRLGDEVVVALKNINIDVMRGEICCILGTSGSGKSTLLNQLAGMEKPTKGEILIGGAPICRFSEDQLAAFRQKHLGFIFQSYNLLPQLTALENVALPLSFAGVDKKTRERAAESMLRQVGLGNRMKHYPGQMSGGQQQRVGIARAFVGKPRLIFADEPTGNLDTRTTMEILQMMHGFARKHGQTIIIVSHDEEIIQFSDRIITLRDGEIIGNILNKPSLEQGGAPDTPGAAPKETGVKNA